ncbi:hypothetical protein LPJ63_000830 [Coemansia sp. RSA 2711]|nr:hypothetical protein LPJ63_000830 [Coemansia sp. RSA 2711]KAJ1843946.1 hypothetical protein LPJ70_003173 [Coemansia sp. RSA 2708]KAJ2317030.1 hypothetical protein IWW52_003344 [Coemansia sp. RSA 2704]KAJ2323587.1 hypothetical protein IWW51_003682 [Coemansia sp. RSA 2702]KAJ2364828.1 hypothetical protein H4S01_003568 [Coemansia sp. RSA 2610]KAJ2731260.1 hypothetical protein H4R23_003113 [Coemansia sp. Cherry 401B]
MQATVAPKFVHQDAHGPLHSRRESLGRYMSSSPEPGSLSPGARSSSSPGRSSCTCDVCGKRYKHRSCLHKHLWEHHDAWEACLKYNLTKHQQVQMMEVSSACSFAPVALDLYWR